MTTSPLPPMPGEEAPIDAEFEPAEENSATSGRRTGGPGWLAYGVVLLIALASFALAAVGSGLVPGFAPGSDNLDELRSEIASQATTSAAQKTELNSLAGGITTLTSRADSLQADRTRTVTELRALRSKIETLQADVSALQRARVASLGETPEEPVVTNEAPIPDLSAIESRLTALEDALVTQVGDYETQLESLKLRVAELETQASAEGLTAATSSNNRTEAALALSAIEAAARRGRPFLSAYQRLETAMPGNAAVQNLAPVSTKAVPTLSDLRDRFPALMDAALDLEADTQSSTAGWMRTLFGDGIQVRQKDAVTARDYLDAAKAALDAGDLANALEQIRTLDSNLQPVFTDWLQDAGDRHQLEETLEALRLTMIAEERP